MYLISLCDLIQHTWSFESSALMVYSNCAIIDISFHSAPVLLLHTCPRISPRSPFEDNERLFRSKPLYPLISTRHLQPCPRLVFSLRQAAEGSLYLLLRPVWPCSSQTQSKRPATRNPSEAVCGTVERSGGFQILHRTYSRGLLHCIAPYELLRIVLHCTAQRS